MRLTVATALFILTSIVPGRATIHGGYFAADLT